MEDAFLTVSAKGLEIPKHRPRSPRQTADSYFHYNHGSTYWTSGRDKTRGAAHEQIRFAAEPLSPNCRMLNARRNP